MTTINVRVLLVLVVLAVIVAFVLGMKAGARIIRQRCQDALDRAAEYAREQLNEGRRQGLQDGDAASEALARYVAARAESIDVDSRGRREPR